MKKILTTMAIGALASYAVANEPVFSADLSQFSLEDLDAWTIIDVNADEKTWQFDESASPSRVFYSYHSSNNADDWLITPAINIPKAGSYVIKYDFRGSAYGENLEVWTGNAPTVEGMTDKIAEHLNAKDNVEGNLVFIDAEEGPLYVGFHCNSLPDKFRLFILDLNVIDASNPVDIMVEQILSPVTGQGLAQENVQVEISNKGRVDVDSFEVAYSIDGGEPVVETVNMNIPVDGKVTYTFNTKADLSVGHKSYSVKAWTNHPDDLNRSNDAAEISVRHAAPAAVPYFMGFEQSEETSDITFLNVNDDSGAWHINVGSFFGNFAHTGSSCLAYNYDSDNAADDWAFIEPLHMEAGHYVVKFWYSATENHPERMKICYGNAASPEAMTNVIAEYNPMLNGKYQEAIHIFEIKEEGDYYIGFHAFSDADENWIYIDDLSIEAVDSNTFDMMVKDITNPTPYMREGSLSDVTYSIMNVGIIEGKTTVNYYIDNQLVKSSEYSIIPMQNREIVEQDLLSGLSEGNHTLKIEALCENDNDLSNNVAEVNFKWLATAYKLWDFEDNVMPEDLTLRKEDSNTDHPDAGEEFNEDGFGIFKLGHYLLGHYALAVNTWFEAPGTADRWVILPQIKVNGDACFVWNANSFNPDFLEHYEVKVSTSDDTWYNFNTVYTNTKESIVPQTRGIDLSSYEGRDIYVAINVRTSDGEALILDNLGLYGDLEFLTTGISNAVAEGEIGIEISGDNLRVVGAKVERIDLFSIDGKMIVSADSNIVDLSGVNNGVYVANVKTANGLKSFKFVKR